MRSVALAVLVAACGAPMAVAPEPGCFRLVNARAPGGAPAELSVRDGRIVSETCATELDAGGRYVVPAFIDAHVHLAYFPVADELLDRGVAGAVDLAAPMGFLDADLGPLRVARAGPMITAAGGYPTESWGADGYGLTCDDPGACSAAVDRLAAAGAALVKVPLAGPPELDDDTLRAVVERAHSHGLRVAVHALSDTAAMRAATAGADLLAHTPVEPLDDETVAAWSSRAVVSTLRAFGGSASAVENLRRLHAAGATVLYGTDLGNTRTAGIDADELALLGRAGLSAADILHAGTRAPASYFEMNELGALEPGRAASFVLVDGDPLVDPLVLARPSRVFIDGAPRGSR